MLCYYRHEKCQPDPGEEHQKTDTSDMVDMLGEKAHKYLKQAKDYNFIAPGAVEVDTEGQLYSERFRASDIDWFKRVIKSFRVSLGYTKKDTDEMMSLLTGILHMGQIDFTDEDAAKVTDGSRADLAIPLGGSHAELADLERVGKTTARGLTLRPWRRCRPSRS